MTFRKPSIWAVIARNWFLPIGLSVAACGLLVAAETSILEPPGIDPTTLVDIDQLPPAVCMLPPPDQRVAMRQAPAGASGPQRSAAPMLATPARTIKDPYPSFAAVAVDPIRNEVVFTDESLFQVLVYDRLENTPPGAEASKPKRVIAGEKTHIEFQSGVYLNPENGEIFAVNNDTRDRTVIFDTKAQGDVAPVRDFRTPHGTFGIAAAEQHGEVILTIQHDAGVITYRKGAGDDDAPIRLLQGDRTRLADPHGIAYDSKEDVVFVANFGSRASRSASAGSARSHEKRPNWPLERGQAVPGSGTISQPSITVYRRTAEGDEPPLRVIEGSNTQFNWPTGVAVDSERRELYVTNDMGASVLVFDTAASGNQAPKRILKGPRTGLANPTGVALDLKNRELWVANFGGHSATVYPLGASGDTPPLRTIRNAPAGSPSLMIGNPGAVTFDTKREEILVPN
jgi:DNA-binding beta-propeller fold protein YncE